MADPLKSGATIGDKDPRVKLWLSATQVDLLELCERKYFFDRILKMRSPTSKAQQFGIDVENHIEADLKNGVTPPADEAGKVAVEMLKFLPARGTDRLDFQSEFRLKVELVPGNESKGLFGLLGKKDLRIKGEAVWDFKTTSDPKKWMKTPPMLIKDIQAQVYAYDELHLAPQEQQSVPLKWVYGKSKGKAAAFESPVTFGREQAAAGIRRAHSAALKILELKQPGVKIEDTKFATNACEAFGGCAHRAYCPARAKNLAQLLGFDTEEKKMGLKDRLKASLGLPETASAAVLTVESQAQRVDIAQIAQVQPAVIAEEILELTRIASAYGDSPAVSIQEPAIVTGDAACIACSGTGYSSRGGPCSPCHGTGYKGATGPDYEPELPSALPAQGVNPPDALLSPDDQPKPAVVDAQTETPVAKRTRKVKAEITPPKVEDTALCVGTIADGGFTLIVDGATVKGISGSLDYLVQRACKLGAEKAGVADYRLLDFGKGPAFVLLAFAELAAQTPIAAPLLTITARLPESQAVLGWLYDRAAVVVRGIA